MDQAFPGRCLLFVSMRGASYFWMTIYEIAAIPAISWLLHFLMVALPIEFLCGFLFWCCRSSSVRWCSLTKRYPIMPAAKSHRLKILKKAGKRISHPESVKTQHIHNLILIQRTIYFGLSAVKMIRFFIVSARKNPCRLFYEDIFLLLKSKSMPFGQAWHVSRASAGTRSIRAAKR